MQEEYIEKKLYCIWKVVFCNILENVCLVDVAEENQIAIADVSISSEGSVFSERKINYSKKVIESL